MSEHIEVGQQIKFAGDHYWWTVRARDDRYIVATRQAQFRPVGEYFYTIIDTVGFLDRTYNGVGNGPVRSSLNTLGGGWDLGPNFEGCGEMIRLLNDGRWELSHRRLADGTIVKERKA